MKTLITLILMALPLPAVADTCDHWTAAMEEDEGGSVMTAHICTPVGNDSHQLFIRCDAPGKLSIRFVPVAPAGYPPSPEFTTDIEFGMDQEMFTRPARYEDMDGAMAVETAIDAPFISTLQVQREVTLSDVNGKIPGATFTLKGSRAALGKLIASCPKQ